jgi:hypothetical protein
VYKNNKGPCIGSKEGFHKEGISPISLKKYISDATHGCSWIDTKIVIIRSSREKR